MVLPWLYLAVLYSWLCFNTRVTWDSRSMRSSCSWLERVTVALIRTWLDQSLPRLESERMHRQLLQDLWTVSKLSPLQGAPFIWHRRGVFVVAASGWHEFVLWATWDVRFCFSMRSSCSSNREAEWGDTRGKVERALSFSRSCAPFELASSVLLEAASFVSILYSCSGWKHYGTSTPYETWTAYQPQI